VTNSFGEVHTQHNASTLPPFPGHAVVDHQMLEELLAAVGGQRQNSESHQLNAMSQSNMGGMPSNGFNPCDLNRVSTQR